MVLSLLHSISTSLFFSFFYFISLSSIFTSTSYLILIFSISSYLISSIFPSIFSISYLLSSIFYISSIFSSSYLLFHFLLFISFVVCYTGYAPRFLHSFPCPSMFNLRSLSSFTSKHNNKNMHKLYLASASCEI